MRAAILYEQNAPLELVDLNLPALDVGQVLVKIEYAGICGKQIDEITGRQGPDHFLPHLLGHEGGGVVVDVGPGVRKVKKDDRVVLHWVKGSGIDSLPPRYSHKGREISAGWVTTFSDYTIASENRLTVLPSDAPGDVMALLGCAVTTGIGIILNDAKVRPGESVLVIGCGGVGLSAIMGARLVNADPIFALDIETEKLSKAIEVGANIALMPPVAPRLFDVVVDTTGNNAVREQAYSLANGKTGRVILAGVPHHDDRMSIDSFPLHMGRTMIGSHGGGTNPDIDIPRYYSLYRLGKLRLGALITGTYPLDEINQAIDRVRQGHVCGRCLIKMP